jgi:hypothetical protein
LVHAGSKFGFVEGAELMFTSAHKPKPGDDYHGDMDKRIFKKWVEETLLPNLPPKCLIIMDNASYHSFQVSA